MDKEHIQSVLEKANELCQEKYRVPLYDKLGLRIRRTEDLAAVLSSDKLDYVMTSGRIEFSRLLPSIGTTIASSLLLPGILGKVAGFAWLIKPEQEEKGETYRDIVKQLYSNPDLYNAYKQLSQDGGNDNPDEANQLLLNLGL